MEKVSEADLVKRVKAFILNDNYAGALAVVKGVDASRIKNPPILCMIGEVYMHEKQYQTAEEVFLKAYEKSPKSRKILDLITSLYIEMGEYAEAEYYYKEFIAVASRDLHRYILRYRLDKGKGERLSVLIDTLEKLKDYEYMEEWAYELATLYEAAGDTQKCIHECDEIVLWFGHGEYVDKAIELKCRLSGDPMPKMTTVEVEAARDFKDDQQAAREASVQETEAAREVLNPYNALEYAGVETGIDTDMIEKALEKQSQERVSENPKPMSNTGLLFDAMTQAAQALEALKEKDLDDEDDDFIDEVIDTPQSQSDEGEPDNFDAALDTMQDFKNILKTSSGIHKITHESESVSDEKALDAEISDEAILDDDDDFADEILPAGESFDDIMSDFEKETSDWKSEEKPEVEPEEELEEDLEGMTEDADDVLLEQAVFGGLSGTNMLEDDLDEEDEIIGDDDEVPSVSKEDEAFLAQLFSEGEESTGTGSDVAMSETVRNAFATVPNVKDVHQQLAMTFTQFETSGSDYDVLAPYDINFVVLSGDKVVKSQIAIGIIKALNTYGICDKQKIVRAKAEALNRQDFSIIFNKIKGGCLIIEQADELSDQSVAIIEKVVSSDNQDVAIVLESLQDEMHKFWKKHRELRGHFLNVINVSKYNEMELVTLAKGYIEKKGYELSPEGAIALKNYFKRHVDRGEVVNYEDVMNVVDRGIANLDERNMKNLFMTVLDNKYEEASMFRLIADDFKNI
ncbi:MAG: hypothetical protein ACLU94_00035 [Catenibacillus sp.]